MVDIEGEFELWTPLDDIEFPNIDNEINTYIIRGDDGTSKKDRQNEDVKKEEDAEDAEDTDDADDDTEEDADDDTDNNNAEEEVDSSKVNKNKGYASKKTAKKDDKKKSSIFSRFSKNKSKPVNYKPFDHTKHKLLIGALKDNDEFKNLIDAIKENILDGGKEKEGQEDEFYFQIHNQLMNSELFETFAKSFPEEKEKDGKEKDGKEKDGLQYIAEQFSKKDDVNIQKIIKSIKDEEAAKVKEGGEEGEEGEEGEGGADNTQNNNQVGGGNDLLKMIKKLKKSLKQAELGVHLKKMVRLPKKELFLTLNFVQEEEEGKENQRSSQDIQTNMKSKSVGTGDMLKQLSLELQGHIDLANKELKIKKGDAEKEEDKRRKEEEEDKRRKEEEDKRRKEGEAQKDQDFDKIDEVKSDDDDEE